LSAEADNRHEVPREDDFNRLKWREKVKPENNPKTILLRVEGMDCADCALHLEKAALSVPGVRSAEVSFATGRMRLVAEERERVLPQVEAVARRMGYQVLPVTPTAGGTGWRDWLRRHPRVWPTALAGLLLLADIVRRRKYFYYLKIMFI
jgi:Cation transport ATPase